jgi:hypothetical protein
MLTGHSHVISWFGGFPAFDRSFSFRRISAKKLSRINGMLRILIERGQPLFQKPARFFI